MNIFEIDVHIHTDFYDIFIILKPYTFNAINKYYFILSQHKSSIKIIRIEQTHNNTDKQSKQVYKIDFLPVFNNYTLRNTKL